MDAFGQVVRTGRWLYAGSVEVRVRIRESEMRWGSGDHDDPPNIRDDIPERCYYLDWDGAGPGQHSALSGPFATLQEAEEFAQKQSGGTVLWDS
jgi:hypothetical protein